MEFERGCRIVLIGDMQIRAGCSETAGVARKWGINTVNGNGEYLVDICAGSTIFANIFFSA